MKQVNCGQREFHLPHKAIIFENAEGTEWQIVYDALVREDSNACLEGENALHNLLWSILIRLRFKPITFCGDLQKVFLQIRIKKEEGDALRFH